MASAHSLPLNRLRLCTNLSLRAPTLRGLVCAVALACIAPHGAAGIEDAKLLPANLLGGDQLGYSADISGNTLVLGARGDGDQGASAGSVAVFVRSAGVWTEQAELHADDGVQGLTFGSSVAIDGDTVVVGAMEAGFFGAGSAYVFVRNGSTWSQEAKLVPSAPRSIGSFGASVDIDGETVIVGAPHPQNLLPAEGDAYIYVRSGTTWTEQERLLADDGGPGDWFGTNVAISGDLAVVGASKFDTPSTDAGAAYVFSRTGAVWSQKAKILADGGAGLDRFGASVDIDGDTIAVGAWGDDDLGGGSGSVRIYRDMAGTWVEEDKLLASDGDAGAFFGGSVELSGDSLVVGANNAEALVPNVGAAYVFARTVTTWSEVTKLVSSDGASSDSFAYSVGLDDDTVIIGAQLADGTANQSGAGYVFENVVGVVDYGAGCPGTGGVVPAITMTGDASEGGTLHLTLAGGLPSAQALVLLGTEQAALPIGFTGCLLLVGNVLPVELGPFALDGSGSADLPTLLPLGSAGVVVTAQAFLADGGTPQGWSATNGVQLTVQP